MVANLEAQNHQERLSSRERVEFWVDKAKKIIECAVQNNIAVIFRGSLHAEALQPGFINDAYKLDKKQWRDIDVLVIGEVNTEIAELLKAVADPIPVGFGANNFISFDDEQELAYLVYKDIKVPVKYDLFAPTLLNVHDTILPFLDPLVHYHLFETVSFGGITGPRLRDKEKMDLYLHAKSRFADSTNEERAELFSPFLKYRNLRAKKYPLETWVNKLRGDFPAPKSKRLRMIVRSAFNLLNFEEQKEEQSPTPNVPDVIPFYEQRNNVSQGGESVITPIGIGESEFAVKAYKDTGSLSELMSRAREIMNDYYEFASFGLADNAPRPNLFIAEDPETKEPRLYGLQEWIGGGVLRDLSILSLIKNKELRAELSQLLLKITKYYELYGMMPDTVGAHGIRVLNKRIPSLENLVPIFSRNIAVDQSNKPHFIDTGVRKDSMAQGKVRALIQYIATKQFAGMLHRETKTEQREVNSVTQIAKDFLEKVPLNKSEDKEISPEAEPLPFKRVLIVCNSLGEVNGVNITIENFVRYLRANGVETVILSSSSEDSSTTDPVLGRVVKVRGIKSPYGDRYISSVNPSKFLKLLDGFEPEKAVLFNPTALGVEAAILLDQLGIYSIAIAETNYAAYIRNEIPGAIGKAASHMVKETDSFIKRHLPVKAWVVPSPSYFKKLEGESVRNLKLIPKGIRSFSSNQELEQSSQIFKELIAPNGEIVLLFVGKVARVKNLDFILRVTQLLEQKNIPYKLLIVGDNKNKQEKEELLSQFNAQNMLYLGTQHDTRLQVIYQSSDLFIFPSTTETLGIVTMEAMQCGLPVLGADAVGTKDLIFNGINGYKLKTTEPGNVSEWAAKITMLSKDRRRLKGLKARTAASESFGITWEEYSRKIVQTLI